MQITFFRDIFWGIRAKPLTFLPKYVMLFLANSCVKELRGNKLWAKKRPTLLSVFFRCREERKDAWFPSLCVIYYIR